MTLDLALARLEGALRGLDGAATPAQAEDVLTVLYGRACARSAIAHGLSIGRLRLGDDGFLRSAASA